MPIVALLVIGALVAAWAMLANRTPNVDGAPTPSVTATASHVATPTPTPSPTQSETPQPSHATSDPDPASPSQPVIPGAAAVVTLASLDSSKAVVVVGGFVSGVMEDGGTCTFTVTAADTGASVTFKSTGAFNVDSTTCGSHDVGAPASKSGAYSVTLEYTNAVGAVTSSPVSVEGP